MPLTPIHLIAYCLCLVSARIHAGAGRMVKIESRVVRAGLLQPYHVTGKIGPGPRPEIHYRPLPALVRIKLDVHLYGAIAYGHIVQFRPVPVAGRVLRVMVIARALVHVYIPDARRGRRHKPVVRPLAEAFFERHGVYHGHVVEPDGRVRIVGAHPRP